MTRSPHLLVFLLWLAVGVLLAGCLRVQTEAPPATSTPTPTETPVPPTPTATVVWFPPTATLTPFPTVMISPTETTELNLGELILEDTFEDGTQWGLSSTTAGGAALGKNSLSIALSEPRAYVTTVRQQPILADFYMEISANPSLCRDADEYGLLLRVSDTMAYYRFGVTCDAQVRLDRLISGGSSSPQPPVYSAAIPPGALSSVKLSVWASGNDMRFYINDVYEFSVRDPLLPTGRVGMFARSAGSSAVTVTFSDLKIWEILP